MTYSQFSVSLSPTDSGSPVTASPVIHLPIYMFCDENLASAKCSIVSFLRCIYSSYVLWHTYFSPRTPPGLFVCLLFYFFHSSLRSGVCIMYINPSLAEDPHGPSFVLIFPSQQPLIFESREPRRRSWNFDESREPG